MREGFRLVSAFLLILGCASCNTLKTPREHGWLRHHTDLFVHENGAENASVVAWADIAFSADGQTLAAVGRTTSTRRAFWMAWNVRAATGLQKGTGGKGKYRYLDFSPDGNMIVLAGQQEPASVIALSDGRCLATLSLQSIHQAKAMVVGRGACRFSAAGNHVYVKETIGVSRWSTATWGYEPLSEDELTLVDPGLLDGESHRIDDLPADSAVIVMYENDGHITVRKRNTHSVDEIGRIEVDSGDVEIEDVNFSIHTGVLAARIRDAVYVWDSRSGEKLMQVENGIISSSLSQDGKYLALLRDDGECEIRGVLAANGEVLRHAGGRIVSFAWSPRHDRFAAAHQDGRISVWDIF